MRKQRIASFFMLLILLVSYKQLFAIPVSLELALLVDVSRSVDASEYAQQKNGYVNAFKDPVIQDAIASFAAIGGIAVTYIEWSGANQQSVSVGWTQITNAASANAFADAIDNVDRAFGLGGGTAPGSAIQFVTPKFSDNGFEGNRWVIDVSSDGIRNTGTQASVARDHFLDLETVGEGLTKTINGLPIDNTDLGFLGLADWFQDNIVGGPNAFLIAADGGFDSFSDAVKTKIGREISEPPTSVVFEPTSLSLILIGLIGFYFVAYQPRRIRVQA
ncbi:MAG TPA: DUF1194 domain-containing protein [Nitrosomonas sp.]|nr:DUF1194 domain-containing protein [Nitrosomonas sp.]HMW19495.1 DUF1194 domain-containing protein [Nitrosomonas sp.]HMY61477.1 DUF1194 domain-containing protein [Nitrosomonas sp.]HMY90622.1 DUF1194 domain-containing protein [Nitrosomonas sp.]HNA70096.1 DUF1194 domain-containing protein [Nitrosomonas sp.]